MEEFFKDNWFKIGILVALFTIAFSIFHYSLTSKKELQEEEVKTAECLNVVCADEEYVGEDCLCHSIWDW